MARGRHVVALWLKGDSEAVYETDGGLRGYRHQNSRRLIRESDWDAWQYTVRSEKVRA